MLRNKKGFTLIELVIVIVILGILSAVALPKFVDLVTDAKISATKAGLGAIRAVIALKYSQRVVGNTTPYYTDTIVSDDFFDGKLPENKLNSLSAVTTLATNPTTSPTSAAYGWWYVYTDTNAGQAGAYSDTTTRETGSW